MLPFLRLTSLIAFATIILVSYAWVPSRIHGNDLLVSLWRRPLQHHQSSNSIFLTTTMMMISKQQLGSFEIIETSESQTERRVALLDYTICNDTGLTSLIDFDTAWEYQKQIMNQQIERLKQMEVGIQSDDKTCNEFETSASSFLPATLDDDNTTSFVMTKKCHDTVIILQHNPVFTLGTGSDDRFLLSSCPNDDGVGNNFTTPDTVSPFTVPVVRMDRGGEVTYHGPGQITVYPILDLRGYRQDIHWYMRALEEAIILAISKCDNNLQPERQDGVTGVWIKNHKIGAVGIKCRKWITMHGLAVNVEESSVENFKGIVPCGLEGRKVGFLSQFLDNPITVHDFSILMKEALEEVFQIELINQELMH